MGCSLHEECGYSGIQDAPVHLQGLGCTRSEQRDAESGARHGLAPWYHGFEPMLDKRLHQLRRAFQDSDAALAWQCRVPRMVSPESVRLPSAEVDHVGERIQLGIEDVIHEDVAAGQGKHGLGGDRPLGGRKSAERLGHRVRIV